jgi:3-mercaptopyruvate sulfurtransferase SseA
VVCGSGDQASIAASFLNRAGYEAVGNVVGGMSAWTNAELPTSRRSHQVRRREHHNGQLAGDGKLER